jgi:hypothetical protein
MSLQTAKQFRMAREAARNIAYILGMLADVPGPSSPRVNIRIVLDAFARWCDTPPQSSSKLERWQLRSPAASCMEMSDSMRRRDVVTPGKQSSLLRQKPCLVLQDDFPSSIHVRRLRSRDAIWPQPIVAWRVTVKCRSSKPSPCSVIQAETFQWRAIIRNGLKNGAVSISNSSVQVPGWR